MPSPQLSGFLLAGGRGRRFGGPKTELVIGGESLVDRALRLLGEITAETFIIVGDARALSAESALARSSAKFGARIIVDELPGAGPLGAILTGLKKSSFDRGIFLGCDMPFVNAEALGVLCDECDACDVVLPIHHGTMEPLFALYTSACIAPAARLLREGRRSILDLYPEVTVRTIEGIRFGDPEKVFFNINTPRDYDLAKAM